MTRSHRPPVRRSQAGAMMLEALIAILIFSIGILGIVGLQATAIQQSTDAKYRSEAAQLAEELIGEMWTTDRIAANLATQYNSATNGTRFQAFYTRVHDRLPGVATTGPTAPYVNVDGFGVVTVTVRWRPPSADPAAVANHYDTKAQIR